MDRVELRVLVLKLDINLLLPDVLKNDLAECLANICARDRALSFEFGTHGDLLKSPSEYLKDSEVSIGGSRSKTHICLPCHHEVWSGGRTTQGVQRLMSVKPKHLGQVNGHREDRKEHVVHINLQHP